MTAVRCGLSARVVVSVARRAQSVARSMAQSVAQSVAQSEPPALVPISPAGLATPPASFSVSRPSQEEEGRVVSQVETEPLKPQDTSDKDGEHHAEPKHSVSDLDWDSEYVEEPKLLDWDEDGEYHVEPKHSISDVDCDEESECHVESKHPVSDLHWRGNSTPGCMVDPQDVDPLSLPPAGAAPLAEDSSLLPNTFAMSSSTRGMHTGKEPLVCSECGKAFGKKHLFERHMLLHSREKPFVCSECGKAYLLKRSLNAHMVIHSGERPFVCEVCSKTFNRIENLRRHEMIHTGDRPYTCEECGRSFNQRFHLTDHRVSKHTPKLLPGVAAGKKQINQMKKNAEPRIISDCGTVLYVCSECGKAFSQKQYLDNHLMKHTKERPFICKVCGLGTKHKHSLKRHMQSRHSSHNIPVN